MVKLTATIHTASEDGFLAATHGIQSALEMYLDCLNRQTFPASDFELVFVDLFWPANKHAIDAASPPFTVKYVPCVHDFWLKKGLVGISSAKNSAILFAEGELVVTFDDAEIFPSSLLETYWTHHQNGDLAHAFYKRLRQVNTENGRLQFPIQGDEYVNDRRMAHVENGAYRHTHGGWLYAGTSFTLADALEMNGFNERLDGCKALEDCEFGCRMQTLGRRFVLDPECFFWILDHDAVYANYLRSVVNKNNGGFIVANNKFNEVRANHRPLRQEELAVIDEQTVLYHKAHVDFSDPGVKDWTNYRTFNLNDERKRCLDAWYSGAYSVAKGSEQ